MKMFKDNVDEHINVFSNLSSIEDHLNKMYTLIEETIENKNKILIFGNGGSAADAQHFAAELVVKFEKIRKPISAIALTTDTSILTATANDFSFNDVFSRQVSALIQKDDLAIGISTSGKSKNVLNGLKEAERCQAKTIMLTGNHNINSSSIDLIISAPSKKTSRIQEVHLFIYHYLCLLIDENFQ